MNVLSKFTIKNLKLNKKRTIVTGIGIVLSAALICAVAGMVTSVKQTMINAIKSGSGDYHTAYYNVPSDKLKYIEENQKIESYFETTEFGWSELQGAKNENKPYAMVLGFTDEAMEKTGIKLKEGSFPKSENEIVIPEHVISNARLNLKIGDEITLDIGERKLKTGEALTRKTPIFDEETSELLNEEITNTKAKTYKIVGIIERPDYNLEGYDAAGYTFITYISNTKSLQKADIYVRYSEPKNYEETQKEILSINSKENQYESKNNTELLRYEGAISEATMKVLYGIAAVVIVIIVVSSVFVIRNSFSISVAEKNKQYGMLSSIGATGKQIRKSVLLEGLLIGIVAIPVGIICGIVAIVILIWLLNVLLKDMLNGILFVYSVPFIPILLTILMSSITIYLSCLIPSIRAGKISPIDSIRGNNDIKIKAKKLRTSKLFRKIFGIGGVIANKNLKRNRKKYRTTIISLVVSVSIFIALSSFMGYGTKMTDVYYTELTYNISVNNLETDIYDKILKLDGIDAYAQYKIKNLSIDMDKYGTDIGKKANECIKGNTKLRFLVVNDEAFKRYLNDIKLSTNDFNNKAILVDEFMIQNADGTKTIDNVLNVKEGEKISVGNNEDNLNIEITKRTDKRPMGYEGTQTDCGTVFVSESYAKNVKGLEDAWLYIKATDATKLETQINEIKETKIDYAEIRVENLDMYAQQANRLYLIISIFLYGFIAVITLIGVTNIFNTITTNMILRSKEFAMLKSIGMTKNEFNKMIRLESILYGLKSLIIGIPIGLAGTYFIYKSFAENTDIGYIFPLKPIILATIFVFIIVGLTMKYSLNKINKQNIIETIRNDNI